jgi:GST-like protein
MRAALLHDRGRHFQGRSVQAAVSGNLPEQSHAGDRRSRRSGRQADLGRKTGKFYPKDERGRVEVDQWLFWQMANLGPKAGEANHFRNYAPQRLPYAIERFGNEMNRIYGVMNRRLEDREFLAGRYSIADIACIGWASRAERHGHDLSAFANVRRWLKTVLARPAVKRGLAVKVEAAFHVDMKDPNVLAVLFNQRAR